MPNSAEKRLSPKIATKRQSPEKSRKNSKCPKIRKVRKSAGEIEHDLASKHALCLHGGKHPAPTPGLPPGTTPRAGKAPHQRRHTVTPSSFPSTANTDIRPASGDKALPPAPAKTFHPRPRTPSPSLLPDHGKQAIPGLHPTPRTRQRPHTLLLLPYPGKQADVG